MNLWLTLNELEAHLKTLDEEHIDRHQHEFRLCAGGRWEIVDKRDGTIVEAGEL